MIKKSLKPFIMIAAVICIFLLVIALICLHPADKKITTIEQYQKIIEEVNKEYDASFMVPEGTEEQVLQNILTKGETENEFRESLISAWKFHKSTGDGSLLQNPNTKGMKTREEKIVRIGTLCYYGGGHGGSGVCGYHKCSCTFMS